MCVEETILIISGTTEDESEKFSLKRIVSEEEKQTKAI
jgi:hypothetical protein